MASWLPQSESNPQFCAYQLARRRLDHVRKLGAVEQFDPPGLQLGQPAEAAAHPLVEGPLLRFHAVEAPPPPGRPP